MKHIATWPRRALAVFVVVGILGALISVTASAGAARSVRGFDGKTITVASLGIKGQLPLVEVGAQARIKRFNDTNEIKGVQIKYSGYANDQQDPATALSEARRLVTQDQVFALVGDASANNPVTYLAQQHVPYFGGGFDHSYCSPKPSTNLWGYGIQGCIQPEDPAWVGDFYKAPYEYAVKKTGKKHPTMVIFGANTDSGKRGNKFFGISAQGAGFKVVSVQSTIPQPPPSDYTPYVQQMLTGDNGHPSDIIVCEMTVECVSVWDQLKANNYKGIYLDSLLSDILVKLLAGSAAQGPYEYFSADTPGMKRFKADLDAFQSGVSSKADYGALMGYMSTDLFIKVLKKVAAKGKSNITPENVQKAASTIQWDFKGVMGATTYPKSTVYSYPACLAVYVSNGTAWTTGQALTCSTKTYSPNLKVG